MHCSSTKLSEHARGFPPPRSAALRSLCARGRSRSCSLIVQSIKLKHTVEVFLNSIPKLYEFVRLESLAMCVRVRSP